MTVKKRKQIVLARVLVLVLLITQFSSVMAFAGSKNKNNNTTTTTTTTTTTVAPAPVVVPEAPNVEIDLSQHTYMLAVANGGSGCDSIDKIILTYKSTGGSIMTQVLNPSGGQDDYDNWVFVSDFYRFYGSSVSGTNSSDTDTVSCDPAVLSGSRYMTYSPVINSDELEETADIIKAVNPCGDDYVDQYLPYESINNPSKESTFTRNDVEYLHFRTVEPIDKVIELSFVMSNTAGGDDWVSAGWNITEIEPFKKLDDASISNMANTVLYDSNGVSSAGIGSSAIGAYSTADGDIYIKSTVDATYKYVGPEFHRFSKTSSYLGLSYSGKMIAKSDSIEDDINLDTLDMIVFVDKSLSTVSDGAVTASAINTAKFASIDDNHCNTFKNVNETYSSQSREYLFEVQIDNTYGSGISSLIAYQKNEGMIFNDPLMATINYNDSLGQNRNVVVPVISSSLVDYTYIEGSAPTSVSDANGINWEYANSIFGTSHSALNLLWGDNKETSNSAINNFLNGEIKSYAQDGTNIYFVVDFPDLATLNSISLRMSNPVDDNDVVSIKSVEVYKTTKGDSVYTYLYNDNKRTTGDYDNSLISIKYNSQNGELTCMNYYDSNTNARTLQDGGSAQTYNFDHSRSAQVISTQSSIDKNFASKYNYLLTLVTDSAKSAGTQSDVFVTINYIDTNDVEQTLKEFNLREACAEFYGENYGIIKDTVDSPDLSTVLQEVKDSRVISEMSELRLPTVIGEDYSVSIGYGTDANYIAHMVAGASISVPLSISDFKEITSIDFRMDDSEDNWQVDTIMLHQLNNIGERKLYYVGEQETEYVEYRFVADRQVDIASTTAFYKTGVDLLLQQSDTKTYTVDSDFVSGTTTSRDYTKYYYSMEADMARSNLRLLEQSKSYEVRVNVASNIDEGTAEDGTGSNNLFYFQLVFEKGTSGVVLANTQLASDGFRAGKDESFTIICNEDLGDVSAIRIIPDDISDDSSKLDKLCIDKIEVITKGSGAAQLVYNFNDIGWINMEYVDNSIKNANAGRELTDIATIATVSARSYISSLEFAIAYGTYDDDDEQFEGDILMDITYLNSKNEKITESNLSMAQYMYDYSRRSYRKSSDETIRTYQSDPEFMFRANSIDRFVVPLNDISSIVSVTFDCLADSETTLNILGMSVKQVMDEGTLKLNINNEYEIDYPSENELRDIFTGDTDTNTSTGSITNRSMPTSLYCSANLSSRYQFKFADNTIKRVDDTTSDTQLASRLPVSNDDTMNIYIYMKKAADVSTVESPTTGEYTLTTTINYSSIDTGYTYKVKVTDYDEKTINKNTIDEQTVLVKEGVSAKYMTVLNLVKLDAKANSGELGDAVAAIDKVVIQHVRSKETIIASYDIALIGRDAKNGISSITATARESEDDIQKVSLLFDESMPETSLVAEKRDIAVNIEYKSKLAASDDDRFLSENIFLTDSEVSEIAGGSVATFTFNEADVSEITKINITNTASTSGAVKKAIVEVYKTADDKTTLQQYYSFTGTDDFYDRSITLDNPQITASTALTSDVKALHKVQFSFVTSDASEESNIDSAGQKPIALKINYNKVDNTASVAAIEDITKMAGTGSYFIQGGTATVTTFLEGVKEINDITIIPSTDASWNLKSITYSVSDSDYSSPRTILVNEVIRYSSDNAGRKFNLSGKYIELSVTGCENDGYFTGTSNAVTALKGSTLHFDARVFGSTVDNTTYTYPISQNISGVSTIIANGRSTSNGDGFNYTLPSYSSNTTEVYTVTVALRDNPGVNTSITITVNNLTTAEAKVSNGQ